MYNTHLPICFSFPIFPLFEFNYISNYTSDKQGNLNKRSKKSIIYKAHIFMSKMVKYS